MDVRCEGLSLHDGCPSAANPLNINYLRREFYHVEAIDRLSAVWVEGKLVMDSPDEMDLVFDVAVFDTRSGQSRALDRYARAHPAAPGRTKPSRWMLCNTAGSTSSACSGDMRSPAW